MRVSSLLKLVGLPDRNFDFAGCGKLNQLREGPPGAVILIGTSEPHTQIPGKGVCDSDNPVRAARQFDRVRQYTVAGCI